MGNVYRSAFPVVVLLTAALAGCFGGDGEPEATQDPGPTSPVTEEPVLTGRVLTVDYLPIENATVRLHNPEAYATTDPEGAFGFHDVPPGERLLTASHPNFQSLTQRVVVAPGEKPATEFLLEASGADIAYNETEPWDGFISCMLVYGPNPDNSQHQDCGEWDDTDERIHTFRIGPGARHVVVELDWEETTHLSEHMILYLTNADTETPLGQASGAVPVKAVIPMEASERNFDAGGALRVEVRPAPSVTGDEAGADVGAAIQQPFTVYVTVFYHAPAPVDFTSTPPREHSHCPLPSC